jgi:hypothetical protein
MNEDNIDIKTDALALASWGLTLGLVLSAVLIACAVLAYKTHVKVADSISRLEQRVSLLEGPTNAPARSLAP